MRLIILAAGQGFKLDGFNKLLLKDPKTGETVLDIFLRLFNKYDITIVIGYKAIELMNHYPELNYIINSDWKITGNSYSLSLALDETPSVIISSDLFFDEDMVKLIEESPDNSTILANDENKNLNVIRCKTKEGIIKSIYQKEQKNNDPELVGIFKISDPKILKKWKTNCLDNKTVFAGLNLPLDIKPISAIDKKNIFFHEVNTHLDYWVLIKKRGHDTYEH